MEHRCPVCHQTLTTSAKEPTEQAPFFPFCSRRCKLIDLGAWLDVEYRIASDSPPNDSDQFTDDIPAHFEEE